MKPVNLLALSSRPPGCDPVVFENVSSRRNTPAMIRSYELDCLAALTKELLEHGASMKALTGFFFSWTIEHIGKEFDLLKVTRQKGIINIEMKSHDKTEAEMLEQLNKNIYYLRGAGLPMDLYAWQYSTRKLYRKVKNELQEISFDQLAGVLNDMADTRFEESLSLLFDPKKYLVSAMNDPSRFLHHNYFLTSHQISLKKEIMANPSGNWSVYGQAGTGKTLFLMDLARSLSSLQNPVLYIHNGTLQKGHKRISAQIEGLSMISASDPNLGSLLGYFRQVIVDDAQRLSPKLFQMLLECTVDFLLMGYDPWQVLSEKEEQSGICAHLEDPELFYVRRLTRRIRANANLHAFTQKLFNQKQMVPKNTSFQDVQIFYAANTKEAEYFLGWHAERGYVSISYTDRMPQAGFHGFRDGETLIGQEFDKVLVILGDGFHYEDGILKADRLENGLLADRLLYQGMARTRSQLSLLIVENEQLFTDILQILALFLYR